LLPKNFFGTTNTLANPNLVLTYKLCPKESEVSNLIFSHYNNSKKLVSKQKALTKYWADTTSNTALASASHSSIVANSFSGLGMGIQPEASMGLLQISRIPRIMFFS
jgi:hypothetical protein